jgi:hypothetical protein
VATATEDESTVSVTVDVFETVGNVEIGPTRVAEAQVLSWPCQDREQWQRDMIVLVLEYL